MNWVWAQQVWLRGCEYSWCDWFGVNRVGMIDWVWSCDWKWVNTAAGIERVGTQRVWLIGCKFRQCYLGLCVTSWCVHINSIIQTFAWIPIFQPFILIPIIQQWMHMNPHPPNHSYVPLSSNNALWPTPIAGVDEFQEHSEPGRRHQLPEAHAGQPKVHWVARKAGHAIREPLQCDLHHKKEHPSLVNNKAILKMAYWFLRSFTI